MWVGRAMRHLAYLAVTVLAGGALGAVLVRTAPGFEADERELDPRLSPASVAALHATRASQGNAVRYYAAHLGAMLRGDLGISQSLGRPVAELLSQRIPVTFRAMAAALALAWLVGLTLAFAAVLWHDTASDALAATISGSLLCLPSAVVGLLFLFAGGPVSLALALIVFPRMFRYARNVLLDTARLPHILMAKAKGLGTFPVLFRHVLPCAAPQLLALAGISVNIAFGAVLPLEVVCDSPGLGQLAWQAALGRDLPLLVNLTLLVTIVTLTANGVCDLASSAWRSPATAGGRTG